MIETTRRIVSKPPRDQFMTIATQRPWSRQLFRKLQRAGLYTSSRQSLFAKQFRILCVQWKQEAELLSSPAEMAMLPAYQRIIGLGAPAVPLILEEMKREPHFWFWALRAITGQDPVAEEHRGDVELMTSDWLEWAARRKCRDFRKP